MFFADETLQVLYTSGYDPYLLVALVIFNILLSHGGLTVNFYSIKSMAYNIM